MVIVTQQTAHVDVTEDADAITHQTRTQTHAVQTYREQIQTAVQTAVQTVLTILALAEDAVLAQVFREQIQTAVQTALITLALAETAILALMCREQTQTDAVTTNQ